jgi:hypothetical protein
LPCLDDLQFICIVYKQSRSKNVDFKKFAFLRYLDDLQFECIFNKQPGTGSEIKIKARSGKNSFGTPIQTTCKKQTGQKALKCKKLKISIFQVNWLLHIVS